MTLSELLIKIGLDSTAFTSGMDDVNRKLNQLDGESQKAFSGFDKLGSNLVGLGAGLTASITAPLVGIGAAAVATSEHLNLARIGFETMLGSAERAGTFLDELKTFAASTPFEFPELVSASQRMMAMGFSAEQVIPTLRIIGDTVSSLGGGKDTIDGITLALGQMQAKGKVSAQEMNQLAERGVPAWEMLAKSVGVSIPEAMKLAEKGAISAADAVPAILDGMNAKFGGGMEKASKTLTGVWSNFLDQATMTLGEIGTTLTPVLTQVVKAAMPLLDFAKAAAEWFAKLPEPIKTAAIALAAMLAALGPIALALGGVITLVSTIGPAIATVAGAIGLGTGAFLGWLAVIPLVVAALVALGVWVYQNWEPIKAVVVQAWEGLTEMWTATWNAIVGAVTGVWNTFKGAVSSVWDPIASFFTKLWDAIPGSWSEAWSGVQSLLSGVWSGITGIVSTLWQPAKDFLVGIWDGISDLWSNAWNGVSGMLTGLWTGYMGLMQTLWGPVIDWAKGIWDALPESWQAAWDAIKGAVSGLWSGYLDLMQSLWGPVIEFALALWDSIATAWQTRWENITSSLSALWSGFLSLGQSILQPAVDLVVGIWDGITEAWSAIWSGIGDILSGAWGAVRGLASSIWDPIASFFMSLWDGVQSYFSSAWEGIKGALSGVWNGILSTAKAVWGAITDAISSFLEWAKKIPGVNKLMNLDEAWASAKKLTEATNETTATIQRMEQALKDQGITIRKEGLTTEQYMAKLSAALEKVAKAADKGAKGKQSPVPRLGDAIGGLGTEANNATPKVNQFGESIAALERKHQQTIDKVTDLKLRMVEWSNALPGLVDNLEPINQRLQDIIGTASGLSGYTIPTLTQQMNQWKGASGDLETALGSLGVKSKSEYDAIAADAKRAYDAVMGSGIATDAEQNNALLKMLKAQAAAMKANGEQIPADMAKMMSDLESKVNEKAPAVNSALNGMIGQFTTDMKTAFSGLADGIGDAIRAGDLSKVGDAFKNFGGNMKDAFLERFNVLGDAFESIVGKWGESITNWISTKLQGLLSPLTDKLTGWVGGLFGGSDGAGTLTPPTIPVGGFPTIPGGTPTTPPTTPPTVPGGGGGGGGGIGGAVGGLAGGINLAAGVATAVSGVIGNFQMAGMNKTLDLIEHEVRYSQIHLKHILEDSLNPYLPELASIRGFLWDAFMPAFGSHQAAVETIRDMIAGHITVRVVSTDGGEAANPFTLLAAKVETGVRDVTEQIKALTSPFISEIHGMLGNFTGKAWDAAINAIVNRRDHIQIHNTITLDGRPIYDAFADYLLLNGAKV